MNVIRFRPKPHAPKARKPELADYGADILMALFILAGFAIGFVLGALVL